MGRTSEVVHNNVNIKKDVYKECDVNTFFIVTGILKHNRDLKNYK